MVVRLLIAWLVPLAAVAAAQESPRGTIRGVARSADGKPLPGACIVLCDARTGYPLIASSFRTVVQHFQENHRFSDDFVFTVADADGLFRLHRIPYGDYRVVAQAWLAPRKPVDKPLEHYGKEILLLGTQRVRLQARSSRQLVMKPAGTGTLTLNEECGNNATWLMISSAPTRADPVLGPIGWGGDFFKNLIGWNVMPLGDTTVHGLPAGEVHFALFAPDNSPGFAAGSAQIRPGRSAKGSAPFVAGWSNGVHDPPPRLRPLHERVSRLSAEKNFQPGPFLAERLGLPKAVQLTDNAGLNKTVDHLTRTVILPDDSMATVADLLAVEGYMRLQASAAARRKRVMPPAETQPDEHADFEPALRTLHQELGRRYAGFRIKGIDWDAVGRELIPKAGSIKTWDDWGRLVLEMVARLEDSHASVLPGSVRIPQIPFPRWDAGFACLIDDRGLPVVYYVDPESPAMAAGIRIGMTVKSVNGVDAAALMETAMKNAARYQGWSSKRYLRYQAARWFHQSMQRGQVMKFSLECADGTEFSTQAASTLDRRYLPRLPVPIRGIADSGNVSWTTLPGDIGYIYVRRIRADLIDSLDRAVGELKSARGLIVDVRGNSGGGFDAARAHRNFNSEDGREPRRPRYVGPMAVLIDSRCISAGEGWASWFQANGRARFFGTTTAGASSRKTTWELPDKTFKIRFSVKWYRGFLDRPIERVGLVPDVEVRNNAKDLAAGRDTVLEAAREWLLQQDADDAL